LTAKPTTISKTLSSNDVGETGAHQAGMLVPKDSDVLSFFPDLSSSEKNPRRLLTFTDELQRSWKFAFIYYNNRLFGGTRNEYRLTRMTEYMRSLNAKPGDSLVFKRDAGGNYVISLDRVRVAKTESEILKLGSSWRVIEL
jgi:hypothetical protein